MNNLLVPSVYQYTTFQLSLIRYKSIANLTQSNVIRREISCLMLDLQHFNASFWWDICIKHHVNLLPIRIEIKKKCNTSIPANVIALIMCIMQTALHYLHIWFPLVFAVQITVRRKTAKWQVRWNRLCSSLSADPIVVVVVAHIHVSNNRRMRPQIRWAPFKQLEESRLSKFEFRNGWLTRSISGSFRVAVHFDSYLHNIITFEWANWSFVLLKLILYR